jgi:hypothetical protein
MQTITLTTDFGLNDWFVGTMKGVILGLAPRARVVDISHGVPSGDIRAGAFVLATAYRYFPRGTIHVAVVDPGVGGRRAGIVVQTECYCFVGPDNGVLSLALFRERVQAVHWIEDERYFLRPVSRTFHGRDIFAPVAAHLSRGLAPGRVGPARRDFVRLDWPLPRRRRKRLEGEVVYIDRFGNAITNIAIDQIERLGTLTVSVRGQRSCPIKPCYEAGKAGELIGIAGSTGLLELAVKNGSAREEFGLKIGDFVSVGL